MNKKYVIYSIVCLSVSIIILLSIMLPVYFIFDIKERIIITNENERIANDYYSSLKQSLTYELIFSKNIAHIFTIDNQLSFEDFISFSNITLSTTETIQGSSLILKVLHNEREYVEKKSSEIYGTNLYFKDITNNGLVKSSNHSVYYIVFYIYPIETNYQAILINLYSNLDRAKAIDIATSSMEGSITDGIKLVQETDNQTGVLLFYPSVKFNSSEIIGLSSIVLRIRNIMFSSFKNLQKYNDMKIYLYNNRLNETLESLIVRNEKFEILNDTQNYNNEFYSRNIYLYDNYWTLNIILPNVNTLQLHHSVIIICSIIMLCCFIGIPLAFYAFDRILQYQIEYTKIQTHSDVKDTFMGYIFHEIRVPFNTLSMSIKHLLSLGPNDEIKDTVMIMNSSIKQCSRILDDALDVNKIEKGKFQISLNFYSIYDSVKECFKLFSEKCNNRNINYKLLYKNDITNLDIKADEVRITQCMNNYISNAVKFTNTNGSVTVDINIGEIYTLDGKDYTSLTFSVKDSGPGIDLEEHSKIFQPYVQILKNTCNAEIGTGLGLSITKHIIESHKGEVGFHSITKPQNSKSNTENNSGSTFWFTINVEIRPSDISTVGNIKETQLECDIKGKHFLIIDDNNNNCIMMQKVLKDLNVTSDICNNGEDALRVFNEQNHHLVILDKNMPIMDGKTCALNLRKISNIPIIMLSGNQNIFKEMENININGILTKPINFPAFFGLLNNIFKS